MAVWFLSSRSPHVLLCKRLKDNRAGGDRVLSLDGHVGSFRGLVSP